MALNNIATYYEYGEGVEQSFEEAIKYYELSINNKDFLESYLNLAYLF